MKTVQFTRIEIFITKLYYINTFQAAAWTNTPKRREQKRIYTIVRSDISEAETTNNKRLCSTFCIEAIQTRSIARPLCDSRASCMRLLYDTQNYVLQF